MAEAVEAIAERLLALAQEHRLTLATAESCTAGRLATLLADAPGAASTYHGGFVVYTKVNKSAVLGVPAELIAAHTAVSQPIAEAMATGVIERCPADIGIAITGVTGPEPDEDGNPVGLVHVAAARRGGSIRHRCCRFARMERDALRRESIRAALELAESLIEEGKTRPA